MKKMPARGAGPFKVIKRIGPNAYVLELPLDYGISSTFNITDLIEYKEPALIPSEPFGPNLSFKSEPEPECPPPILSERGVRIEHVLDDQAITTRGKGRQCFLVRWQGRPESDDSWIT